MADPPQPHLAVPLSRSWLGRTRPFAVRRYWPAYERRFGAQLLPSQRHAVHCILRCRTPALGGQLFACTCGRLHFAYHSCNHRACPQCGHADATAWLARQRQKLLPVPYYLVTFTVPAQLRRLLRSHQRPLYGALLTQSARALQEVARDHKDFGAQRILADDGHQITFTYRDPKTRQTQTASLPPERPAPPPPGA